MIHPARMRRFMARRGCTSTNLRIVMADGEVLKVGPGSDTLPRQRNLIEDLLALNALQIAERFPPGLLKRWPGYALARAANEPGNLVHILSGSEGTLAAIVSADLKNCSAAGRARRRPDLLCVRGRSDAGHHGIAGFEAGGHRAH